jgi:hypothetical protein
MDTPMPSTKEQLALSHGRTLSLDAQLLSIIDANGVLELAIELRADGPLVRVRATQLRVQTEGEIAVSCQRFAVDASDGIRLTTEGDFTSSVAGDVSCRAGGLAHWEGRDVRVRARRGETQIEAHDDVRIDGERVLLNS